MAAVIFIKNRRVSVGKKDGAGNEDGKKKKIRPEPDFPVTRT
jgi:hypothetical protein